MKLSTYDEAEALTTPPPQKTSNMISSKLGQILVVDDEVQLKNALVEMLNAQGYDTVGCTSGRDALEALRKQDFDVLLSDLMMPEIDGVALLRTALEIDQHLVCIIMTGQGTISTAVDAMKVGAFDYVLKPFRLHALLPVLTRAINVRRLNHENLQLRETVAIHELCQTIAFTLDPQTVLSKLADAAQQQSEADEVSILLPTDDRSELYVAAVRGENRERLLGERIPLEQSISSWVARERQPLLLRGQVDDVRFAALWPRSDISSAISVPLQVAGKLVGVININTVSSPRPFTLGQMKALTILASTAAAALESASLYGQLQQAEEKYRSIFDNAVDGIFQSTPEGRFITVNSSLARILGYNSPEEIIETVTDITHQLYVDPVRRAEANRLQQERGVLQGFEFQAYRKDGEKIWLSANRRTFLDKNGAELYLEGTLEDITESKQAAAALKASEERYRDLVENARDIIYTHDLNGNYTSINKAGEQLTGYLREEVLGLNLAQTVAPEYLEKVRRIISGQLASEEETVYGLEIIAKDGHRIAVEVNTRLVFQDEVPVGVQSIARDVTERKRAEAMQIRRAAQVALRSEINAALAESNTPLRRILERYTEAIVQHLDAAFARIWTLNKEDDVLELQASAGMYTHIDGPHARVPVGAFKIGLIAQEREPHLTNEVQTDPRVSDKEWAKREGIIAFAGYPLIVEDRLVGVMAMFARQRLADDTLDELASVADIISQGIERKRAEEALYVSEEQLRQSQKLEAVGQLAGGVAHDFNNLLTVITGYSDLLLRRLEKDSPFRSSLEEIKKASERATSLTRQLLAFSRKQVLQPKVLQLNAIVADIEKMLRRLIGEDIDPLTLLEPSLGQIKADPGQIEQVILNLAINARDAMPLGGKLTIETANVYLDNQYARRHTVIQPGHYVMLAVSDTGCGIDAETQAHMFEPFFTTKEQGKGTGLGLSTVYGIVKQSGGNIWVYSEIGKGTTFKIYLPRIDEVAEMNEARGTPAELPQGRETVLLTEDEEQVRRMIRVILEMNGYRILEAASGEEALTLYKQHEGQIDLVMTDVVMPQMSGRELAQSLESLHPGIKVLYMSGYTDDAIVRHGLLDEEIAFLQKPFTPDALMRKVREVLDGPP